MELVFNGCIVLVHDDYETAMGKEGGDSCTTL